MESSSLELKVMSCGDLKTFHFFQKLSAYCIVSIIDADDDVKKSRKHKILRQQKTPRDGKGGRNPEWNHAMQFDLKGMSLTSDRLYVKFNICAENILYGSKIIGEVFVPLNDLIEESSGAAVARYVNYQIRTPNGKPSGIISFSYKVIGNRKKSTENDIQEINFSRGFEVLSEKIKYPSVENIVCYPLVDSHCDPLPGFSFPSQNLYHRSHEFHDRMISFSSPPLTYLASSPPTYFASPPAFFHPTPPSPHQAMGYNYGMGSYNRV